MKTIEEKATAYALENAHMGAAVSTIARAYIAGAFEALAGQWKDPKNELPDISHNKLVWAKMKDDYAGMKYQSAYYVGNGVFRNPECIGLPVVAWAHISESHKDEE